MLPLSLENITKRFDKTVAVDGVSLDIKAGELFFLLGPSGCGKTTCLRMVAGFEKPDDGVLRFADRDMTRVPPHKRNTGMVFQNYALWPHLSVQGNVEYGLRVRKVSRAERDKRVKEALEMVQLGNLSQRYPSQMSGGQQQRVALARALVIRPDVLLLDEPLSNLDAQLRLEMRSEIKRLHEQTGTTALYVTHDQEEALSIADRIAVLRDGKLQQVGTPRELYRSPASRFVANFIGETNLIPGVFVGNQGDFCHVETPVGVLIAQQPVSSVESGAKVSCSIRPESWHIGSGTGNQNQLAARLESVMYLGQTEQYQAKLTGGLENVNTTDEDWRELKIAVANPRHQSPQTGQELTLGCAAEDVVVLSD